MAEIRGEKVRKRYYWSVWLEWIEQNRIQKEIDKRSELAWNEVQGWLNKKIISSILNSERCFKPRPVTYNI